MMTVRIGVDTGGTFTDIVLLTGSRVEVHKVRSTPDDPSRAIVEGIAELLSRLPGATHSPRSPHWPNGLEVLHGSTVATNALLERQGARVALLATDGFEDVVRIGRQTRRELYNLLVQGAHPLVDPTLTFGVVERLDERGAVLTPLDVDQVRTLAASLAGRADSVAICFLHSYANPGHELAAAEICRGVVGSVSTSSGVLNEYREFERWSTTVVNAYVAPVMTRYLEHLESQLPGVTLRVMQSNGGLVVAPTARAAAVHTILSGPAAGAVGAFATAQAVGISKAIGFDMGGTSTDVTLLDGALSVTSEGMVGDWPVRVPMVDIHTVGAGGGSIATLDSGGALRVGPQSAGADPGPACYGQGSHFTVTDANLLLGRMHPDLFLGGRLRLDRNRAQSVATDLAARAGIDTMTLAAGVVRVANANMERAMRVVSVQRGHDPRAFVLVAFGGAGAMHACDLARALDIGTVLVPKCAGVLSALGMLLADVTRDYAHSVLCRLDHAVESTLNETYPRLEDGARADLAREGVPPEAIEMERVADLRYVGQSHEIAIAFGPSLRERFDDSHERLYGYAARSRAVEVVALRVRARGITQKPAFPRIPEAVMPLIPLATNAVWFGSKPVSTPVFALDELGHRAQAPGPAILAGASATVVVPPGFGFEVDPHGNVLCHSLPRGRRP